MRDVELACLPCVLLVEDADAHRVAGRVPLDRPAPLGRRVYERLEVVRRDDLVGDSRLEEEVGARR